MQRDPLEPRARWPWSPPFQRISRLEAAVAARQEKAEKALAIKNAAAEILAAKESQAAATALPTSSSTPYVFEDAPPLSHAEILELRLEPEELVARAAGRRHGGLLDCWLCGSLTPAGHSARHRPASLRRRCSRLF